MDGLVSMAHLLVFPGGLFVLVNAWLYEWVDRKLLARLQNRVGPPPWQPVADFVKLLSKSEIVPRGVPADLFHALPIVALTSGLTAALYVPWLGMKPVFGFSGDLVVTIYLLSLFSLCVGLAGAVGADSFSLVGSSRTFTQVFSYEAPFLLALLVPGMLGGSWRIEDILAIQAGTWLLWTQPLAFIVALVGLAGKLERVPFDAPEAETEIVSGALTEYTGRGLALFRLGADVEMVVGLALIGTLFLGGYANVLDYMVKTLGLLALLTGMKALFARLRLDQAVGLWWRYLAALPLLQVLLMILWKGV